MDPINKKNNFQKNKIFPGSSKGKNVWSAAFQPVFRKAGSVIPKKISNRTVLGSLEMLRKQQKLQGRDYSAHLAENKKAMEAHLPGLRRRGGFIEDQHRYGDLKYGAVTIAYAGCEIIAAYNALHYFRGRNMPDFPEMIDYFERDGMLLGGRFGTSPQALYDYFVKEQFKTARTSNRREFDSLGSQYSCFLLTFYNNGRDILDQIHTICIVKSQLNQTDAPFFTGHNVSSAGRPSAPYPSISSLLSGISNGKGKGIMLIGISRN